MQPLVCHRCGRFHRSDGCNRVSYSCEIISLCPGTTNFGSQITLTKNLIFQCFDGGCVLNRPNMNSPHRFFSINDANVAFDGDSTFTNGYVDVSLLNCIALFDTLVPCSADSRCLTGTDGLDMYSRVTRIIPVLPIYSIRECELQCHRRCPEC